MTTYLITIGVTDSAGASATASTSATVNDISITMGETSVLTGVDSGNGNLLAAQQVMLTQPGTIQSLSFYVGTVSSGLRLGLYDATGTAGNPGKLLASTAAFTPTSGWNTSNVIAPVMLQAATYWLAYLPQSNALMFRVAQGVGAYRAATFSYGVMPATFPASPSAGTAHWSFYATLTTNPPPPPPPPPPPSGPDIIPPTVPTDVRAVWE